MSTQVRIFSDERMRLHSAGPHHPERPERLKAIEDRLRASPVQGVEWCAPTPAEQSAVLRVHNNRYVAFIDALRGRDARLDADTAVNPHSVDAAYLAAGAAIDAVNVVMRDEAGSACALVRPPGHHAECDRAMGFCLFNNVAIAAAHAIERHGLQRVLIVDWDVHHGNGTQHIFESRRDVLFVSTHQWPLWPGTGSVHEQGTGDGLGYTINCPLPAGFDDAGYVTLFQRLVVPIADAYQPQLVLVSAGFDAHRDDPLAGMAMTETGFAALCSMMRDVAVRHSHGRIVLVLEGGYNLTALADCVHACMRILAGHRVAEVSQPLQQAHDQHIQQLCSVQRGYWRL